jgi:hypothetical protein
MSSGGWKLITEFDPPGSNDELPEGEDAGLLSKITGDWDEDDIEELVTIEGYTVTIEADVIDYLYNFITWILGNTIPKKMTLERQGDSR